MNKTPPEMALRLSSLKGSHPGAPLSGGVLGQPHRLHAGPQRCEPQTSDSCSRIGGNGHEGTCELSPLSPSQDVNPYEREFRQ
jgi:hypothetical protein